MFTYWLTELGRSSGDLDEAMRLERDFEAQISPSFRRSKEMFERMSSSVTAVAAV